MLFFVITTAVILCLLLVDKWLFLLVMGGFTAGLFAFDKYAAIRQWRRVPEKILLSAALLGGAVFALFTMHIVRHKTRKAWFYSLVFIMALAQLALVLIWR
jgi:uncharacterized membrane protein YsdA (DUF1294 family)